MKARIRLLTVATGIAAVVALAAFLFFLLADHSSPVASEPAVAENGKGAAQGGAPSRKDAARLGEAEAREERIDPGSVQAAAGSPVASASSATAVSAPVTAQPPAVGASPAAPPAAQVGSARRFGPDGKPIGAAPAPKVFDPRFVQPATRMGLVGARTPEIEREIEAEAARALAEREMAIAWAKANGWPVDGESPDGSSFQLIRVENGKPIYNKSLNQEARLSLNVEPLTQFYVPQGPVFLSGAGWTVGLWESGRPRVSHQEFNDFPGRVVVADTSAAFVPASHATHVLGTILGNGFVDPRARGMAWRASARTFDSVGDIAEMQQNGATAPDQPSRVYVSNHSYASHDFGWVAYLAGHSRAGFWHWGGDAGAAEDKNFGRYTGRVQQIDVACRRTPYLLVVAAAGNDRNHRPGNGNDIFIFVPNGSGGWTEVQTTWPNAAAPGADGSVDGGYDTLPENSAKNNLCVGSMQDAVSAGVRAVGGVGMSSFSSYGPTDDGRIKPDVVGNGQDVLSADSPNDIATARFSGTSMASPGVAGTGLLMHEHYFNTTGQYLRSSTLKALFIHTATDVQELGPDYASGWGLIDAVTAVNHLNLHAAEPGGYHLVEGVLSQQAPEFRVSFTASGLIKATLVWTDPEGTEQLGLDNRTKVLVNDLDLTLRGPSGTVHLAAELNPLIPTAIATYNGNDTDNVEVVGGLPLQIIAAVPGVYELVITHKGTLTEPDAADPSNKKQVFSLMLQGNVAADTGTIADGIDNPNRTFTKHAGSAQAFYFERNTGSVRDNRVRNFPIGDSQSAGFETKVTGPVTVTFDWSVSSEAGFDYLRFYNDGTLVSQISGATTNTVSYNVPAGEHILRWTYEKDGSAVAGTDSGWIDTLEFNSLPEAVDNLSYTFTEPVGSNAFWHLRRFTGISSVPTNDMAESGDIAAGQSSHMETVIQGPAIVRFRMVQSLSTGALRAHWAGLTKSVLHDAGNTFKRYSIEIGPGPQTVRWTWLKPVAGTGFGYVDELVVLPQPSSLRDAADLPGTASDLVVENFINAPWIADTADAAPSSPTGERGASSIHTIYTPGVSNDTAIRYPFFTNKGGVVSFWWQASGSAAGSFSLQMRNTFSGAFAQAGPSVGPRQIAAIPGGTAWQQVHLEVPPGYTELRFVYTASTSTGQAWLDQIVVQDGLQHPARGLDRWGSRWETYGSSWHAAPDASNGGIDSTTHSPIFANGSTSLTTVVTGPKKLFFQWKASSEANYDFLSFTMDGEEATPPISGESGWRPLALDIPGGTHVLRWTYTKDGSLSFGQDRGWIDQVALLRGDFGLGTPTPVGSAVVVPVRKDATAGFFLEQSTDLVTWSPVGINDGIIAPHLEDVSLVVPKPGPRAFYRMHFRPEIVHAIENDGFELPAVAPNNFANDAPGWGPDGDLLTATSFENIPGFANSGTQHLNIAVGYFSEMKGTFLGWRGVHSISAAVGNRPGFTQAGNLSSIVLTSISELARITIDASVLPSGTWFYPVPTSIDNFEANLDASYGFKVRLESTGSRSFFDDVRVVTEPQ